ncbi:MAG: succinyl-CoA synthetase, alpha subunit, partial [halophilic archaeon J07HX5]
MGVLIDQETRVLVQGITGAAGRFHAERMNNHGTNVVAGVVPGNGGTDVAGIPVYDTITDAVRDRAPTTAVSFVPPAVAADALFEAIDAGLELVVAVTEGIPV